ncbi:hypothetical protein IWX90DRAFT_485549 [Phyllosticta citrichinensis]|uniref:Uncharacterized protein n=1 Tax=Phyllosticta citrichinensis TaxID=1130410 RepID=A0ABR1XW29_9PEZI
MGDDEKRDMYSWSAELPKETPKGQSRSPSPDVQVDMMEKQDWTGISYFEAMQNLDIEQVSATTEDPVIPDVISKTLRQSNEEALQDESILERQTEAAEYSGEQVAAQASENHGRDLEVEEVVQQDQPPHLRLEKGQHTTTVENQGGLLAALFPEMSGAPGTENRTVEQQEEEDALENQGGLVAAMFPDMTESSDNEKKAVEDDPNGLLDMLFPELKTKQSESEQPPTKTSPDSKEEPGSGAWLSDSLFPEETCGQNGQLPQAILQQKSTRMTSGQKPTKKSKGTVEAKRDSKPGDDSGTTKEPVDRNLKYHDVVPENLLEELFPEESKKQSKREVANRREFVVPRMRLDLAAGPQMRHYIGSGEIKNPRQEHTCIVKLQGVSPRLTEEDIRGLLPPSAHIDGWSSEYIKTIPMRDPTTLDRKGAYNILFRSANGALHFQKRLRNLHDIVSKQAPTSMLSPRAHPLSLTDPETGESFIAALKLYTLGPPSQRGNVYAKVLSEPWPHETARLVHNGGYPQVVDRAPGIAAKVLLHFDGMQPTKYEIVDAIRADGHDRGVPWDIPGGHNGGPTVVAGVVQLSTARRGDAYSDTAALMRKLPPRWLISFRSKAEAHRFVRRWHRRPFPWQPKEYAEYGEDMPTVRAEVLW